MSPKHNWCVVVVVVVVDRLPARRVNDEYEFADCIPDTHSKRAVHVFSTQ